MTGRSANETDDCWNRIGVRGDRSCERLQSLAHCRHCDIHAEAARSIMQRTVPESYGLEWADYYARAEADRKVLDRSVLVFRIGAEWLALPSAVALGVAEVARPHAVPHRRGGVLAGIVSVKGTIYPCMSLAALLGIADEQLPELPGRRAYPRLLLVRLDQHAYAMSIPDLHGMRRFASQDLQPVPTTSGKAIDRYLSGVLPADDARIGLLDHELIGHQFARALR